VFSPFTVPFYVLSLWKALAVAAMLKLFVAALGTYLLGRALGMRFAGALLAGVVFAFGTFFVAWLGWPLVNVAALLPWLLLLSELVVRRPEALSAAGLAAVVALTFFGGHPETTFHAMVAAVVFFTLRLLLAWRRAGRERKALVQPTTPALRYLQSRAPNRFAGFSQLGIGQPLQPNLSMRYGLYDARGYDYPVERRFDSFWRATAALPGDLIQAEQRAAATRRGLRGMSLLSVTDIMQFPNEPALHLPGLHLAYSGADARVYRNTEALPRVFLVSHQRRLSGGRAALRATVDPRFDARRIAVTERQIPGLQAGGGTSRRSAGTARLVSYRSKRIVAAARSRSRSLLVLTDVYYPGWKATLDGRPARIERVDYLFRGVVLPPGRHRVEFRYEPMSWRIGSIVSGVGVAAVAGLALVGWRRRRGARPHRRQRRAPPRSPTAGS
jgi:Bacterial membrane protein YfhO